ncbi:S53 family peptidase [Phenylobacterium sp.]|uniref:S53 family peptidase n=1 Tax=Phenylobacterium sp. TaxID=1871053 RepID=UPI0025CDD948|nr:S53 family peptidase [Phenylobacterium sp.]
MSDRKVFTNSVVPLPDHAGLTPQGLMVSAAQAAPSTEPMSVMFSLGTAQAIRDELEAKVAAGETVPPEELTTRYGADAGEADKLVAWLKSEGFAIEEVSADKTSVYTRAPIDQVEKTLQVKMVPVSRDGVTYMSAQNAPSLPADVGDQVHAILGLQPFRQAHKNFRKRFAVNANRNDMGADGHPTPNVANAPPYLVSEILKAYGADNLGVTGKGQKIAILIDTFPADADLKAFWKANHLGVTIGQVVKINVRKTALPVPEGEETLDASWTSGVAPGAEIRIYASGSLQFSALDRALDRIIADLPANPGLRQLSISLGLGETFMGGPNGEVTTQHLKFLKLAAAGVNVFVSTGDAGSNPDATGHSPTGPLQAEYESTDPAVVAVGGTSLQLAHDGSVTAETAWSSTGGGRSVLFPRPKWQVGAGLPVGQDRLVPDVSAAADPNTGAFLVLHGHAMGIGGTSWSAPMWAGFCALINEARGKAGQPFLPFLNPLLYPLLGTSAFRDITVGSNGAYAAAKGYDLVTGLGAPNLKALIARLTQPPLGHAATAPSTQDATSG